MVKFDKVSLGGCTGSSEATLVKMSHCWKTSVTSQLCFHSSVCCILPAVCRKRNEEKKKKTEFIAVARGPDLELATLRELPSTVIHQNNTLYAIK